MKSRNHPPEHPDIAALKLRALNLRRLMLDMASGKGEGYIAQGLGIADCLAALYFHELRYDPAAPDWSDRDRFVLSTGHYAIAMYAVLAEAGYLPIRELASYGLNGSRLPMSTFDDTPGIEMVGGSLGHGLGQSVGMAIGLRLDGSSARVFNELSDGELQEGSTWEAAMGAATFKLDNLVAVIDCNGIQADGPVTVKIDPVADKFIAFGWEAVEIDGNDMQALVTALGNAREANGRPKAIVLRTLPGKGVPTLERRERAHFVRVANDEWDLLKTELETHHG
ncbi:transketolase [Acidisoma cellulosilytica]|uniref:Transketolase n=1 Tax=Acidisoma cellulosilyticum TaxID=2802395 RepID=A0A963Z4Q1_9PROT|nr:transketolase [Acidisoma cellulosilyticum]MCB8882594.1 transketolase [Acidisoma cellulosilyticum]